MMRLIGFIMLFLSACLQAEPRVIYDSGEAKPISGYSVGNDKTSILPIVSNTLSLGKITKQKVNFPVKAAKPICAIGSDSASLTWLKTHRDRLISLNAMCYLIQADTVTDLKTVAEIAGDLFVFPAGGDFLYKQFGVQHYPVLISSRWIEQ